MTVTELIDRYCQVWNEPDASTRSTLLSSVWAVGATYTDPSVHASGAAELLNHITTVRARRPGAVVQRTSKVDVHHGLCRFNWRIVQADGTQSPEGLDIAFISTDESRIERIIGFFGPAGRM